MKHFLVILSIVFASITSSAQLSSSRYSYTNVANSITQGCTTDYDKAKAIYRWLCRNIAYDTSYSIYYADDCWDNKKGVCQAYCDLFAHIGKCVGLESQIISGRTRKDDTKSFDDIGHAWLFVIVDKAQHQGILIDPTWGAGGVNDGVFKRSNDDMSWFDVRPEWMIFTHLPDDEMYQFLDTAISPEQFLNLPELKPYLAEVGLNGKKTLQNALNGSLDLPKFFHVNDFFSYRVVDVPMSSTLRVGQPYEFTIQTKQPAELAIINGQKWGREWSTGNQMVYTTTFVPSSGGTLALGVKNEKGSYTSVITYNVAQPTAADLKRLAEQNPYDMPEFERLDNFSPALSKLYGFDGMDLLRRLQSGEMTSFPQLTPENYGLTVVSVPLADTLIAGRSYTFKVKMPTAQASLAFITDKNEWFQNWVNDGKGGYSITITPTSPGTINLSVLRPDNLYYSTIRYNVK